MLRIQFLTFFVYILAFLAAGCKDNAGHQYKEPAENEIEKIGVEDCEKCIILSEQSEPQVAIADVAGQNIIWSWEPGNSNVKNEHLDWFNNISDAKLVYDGKYIITCASGGGVALIRIEDKKTLFYAFAGGNTHSIEILPDGNLVSASSTGDHLTVFKVDTLQFPENVYSKKIPIEFGHNVVWDRVNQLLWSAAGNDLISFEYNFNCEAPDLILSERWSFSGNDAHDLFPVFEENALWLTNTTHIFKFDVVSRVFTLAEASIHEHIKSVSSGPNGFPTIIIKPKESWWTDEVLDFDGKSVFYENGLKIYKARWLVKNNFSYPENDRIKFCGE